MTEPMKNEDIAELAGIAAAKVMRMKDPRTGASRASTLDVYAMAALIDMADLARPDLLPERNHSPKKEPKGGL